MTEQDIKHFLRGIDNAIDWDKVDLPTLAMLDKARDIAGVPFQITSNYRTQEHTLEVGGIQNDAHTRVPCKAFDIAISDHPTRSKIIFACAEAGFRRIGFNEKHVHVDDEQTLPYPALWVE